MIFVSILVPLVCQNAISCQLFDHSTTTSSHHLIYSLCWWSRPTWTSFHTTCNPSSLFVSLLSFVSRSFVYCNLQQYKCIHCLSYPKLLLTTFNFDPVNGTATCNVVYPPWCTADTKLEGIGCTPKLLLTIIVYSITYWTTHLTRIEVKQDLAGSVKQLQRWPHPIEEDLACRSRISWATPPLRAYCQTQHLWQCRTPIMLINWSS